ncbi:glycoside hydrolase family 15 protein [Hamadaea tsunoensis]|uniref:glycoside hydrolase family 15 protein n=1 Tax=Hamadaea tsunoensis TaxID=53368 RepID=UPI0004124248|nr:glycoside hydrolase family 15 protein [Hamadaea tsunoensis]
MALPLEEYALIGDTRTAALIGRDGSIDWLCLPRFDSDACFAALLGRPKHGRWLVAPHGVRKTSQRYRADSLVLETEFHTDGGVVKVVDCMPIGGNAVDVIRRVEGVSGRVRMQSELRLRFDFGRTEPWLRQEEGVSVAIAGPSTVYLTGPMQIAESGLMRADFVVEAGESVDFHLAWGPAGTGFLPFEDLAEAIEETDAYWRAWASRCAYEGEYREAVVRSLLTLKALTYAPTGGIVAAPTTSLPEQLGGVRNWDYRFCWVRDATFTLLAFLDAGYTEEAFAWREWLLRAVAGRPEQMQIMYGIDGQRRLSEVTVGWLPGYENSTPVRLGNAASEQFQLDIYGELMDTLFHAVEHGVAPTDDAWHLQRELMEFVEKHWDDPDEGIWEVRGPRRDFTHSKVMAWVAVDRAIRAVERSHLDGPVERWRRLRDQIFDEVCAKGFNTELNSFTQYYGGKDLDAALLLIPAVGFLPPDDPRVLGTIAAIERELVRDGFVLRYSQHDAAQDVDGLPPGEGAFLPCAFWLADAYILRGDLERGRDIFERLLALRNDVGLLSEEYDVARGRLVGNFPQALTHLQIVATAFSLAAAHGPTQQRSQRRHHR